MSNIDELLEIVKHINEKYSEISKITGDNFNIFQTLDLRSRELIHSKFIAELLNPKGSHGMGNVFLKLFLDTINRDKTIIDDIQKFENANVEIEKITQNGIIDIAIISKGQVSIVIENKIYAGDQEKQLARYKKACPNATIIYLTLDGKDPSDNSITSDNGEKIKYEKISYKKEIMDWLEQCKEKTTNFPLLRETIAQYINILKDLTGQTRSKDMSKEIIEAVIKSPENVISAFEINANADKIKEEIVLKRFVPAMEKLAAKHGLAFEYTSNQDCLKKWWSISLTNELLQKNEIRICFQFDENNLEKLVYGFGISAKDSKASEVIYNAENTLRKRIKDLNRTSAPWWIFYSDLYEHFWREELADLVSENSNVINKCEDKITELLELLK